ncbi:MAG: FlgO family outer membrane protein [Candidatus Latescibacterota bacterium]
MKTILAKSVAGTLIIGAVFSVGCAAQKEAVVRSTTAAEQYGSPMLSERNDLDSRLAELTRQIVNSLTKTGKTKIAVIEFSDLDGNITEFGKYLSEELITRLFTTGKFEVVERQLLNKVLEEHKLTLTGLIDETSAKELGKILGVDAIASGSVTDLGASVKVNARLIATETGSVFAVAAVKIVKDATVEKLMQKVSSVAIAATAKPSTPQSTTTPTKDKTGKIFYFEDFSGTGAGELPDGWIGGKALVKKEGQKSFITNFQKGEQAITTSEIEFPEDWELEIKLKLGARGSSDGVSFRIDVSNLYVYRHYYDSSLFNLDGTECSGGSNIYGENFFLSIRKRGNVFKLFLNRVEIGVIRKPNFKTPRSITFSFGVNYTTEAYRIHEIVGRRL